MSCSLEVYGNMPGAMRVVLQDGKSTLWVGTTRVLTASEGRVKRVVRDLNAAYEALYAELSTPAYDGANDARLDGELTTLERLFVEIEYRRAAPTVVPPKPEKEQDL